VIDLHLHTTASDGRCSPGELIRRAWGAGLTVLSVTDHDTMAATAEARTHAAAFGIRFVPGIEITAVEADRDVHVLGYFLDPDASELSAFLMEQRQDRRRRIAGIGERLAALGMPIDVQRLLDVDPAGGRSIGRPQVAVALMQAGYVATPREAFDRFIGEGCPAYEPRRGAPPAEVAALIGRAGGVASLAHPALLRRDDLVLALIRAGLPALEVFHSDHDAEARDRYGELARAHGLAVTGGSDYHGESSHRAAGLGSVGVPPEEFVRFCALAPHAARP
jgi:3',5'-nucleoside bisphosphate phosphatase